jgi:hypothetical protein
MKRRKANWIGQFCVGTALKNTLLKERLEGWEDEEEEVTSYWMTLRKR